VVLLLRVWSAALARAATVEIGSGARAAPDRSGARPALALTSRLRTIVRPGPVYAVAAKELRYLARDPRRRLLVVQTFLIGVVGPIFVVARAGSALGSGSVLFATAAGYLAVLNAMNQFGYDGAALWVDVVAGNDVRAELIGKNLAIAVSALPLIAVSSIVLAALSGGWAYIPVAIVLGLGGLGAGLAVANVVSVRWPMRLPETRTPFAGSGQGQGCVTWFVLMVCVLVQGLLLAPIAVAAAVAAATAPIALGPVAVGAALYGWLLWRAGVGMAERWVWWRQPELLLAVHPRRD
jgi:ABC-2 type transport system permease protein